MSLTFDEARHFLARTTFGGTPDEIRRVMQLDHGTAASHFFMGGRVKGGFYGAPPSLKNLQAGDLKHTLDYRALYATVIEKWWGLPAMSFGTGRDPAIDCFTR